MKLQLHFKNDGHNPLESDAYRAKIWPDQPYPQKVIAWHHLLQLLYLDMIHNGGDRPVSATTHADKQDVDMVEVASDEVGWLGVLNQQPV
ncbi:hypothetical protein EMCRGX_G012957 [Ephydatia muelleri]|eukprot:Em0004g541a